MLQVKVPESLEELDHVRTLFRSFIRWHRTRHHEDIALIDAYFDADAFEAELENLPGTYSPPEGGLYLASVGGSPAGCVAMRRIDPMRCEMKRMLVYPEFHGKRVGRALAEAVIACGAAAGYKSMLLDTSVRQMEAQALYTRLGFRQIAPYYELPDDLREWLVFMERPLAP